MSEYTGRLEDFRARSGRVFKEPSDMGVVMNLLIAATLDQERRLEAMEARARAAELHDPDCPKWLLHLAQQQTGAYLYRDRHPCSCWLAGDEATSNEHLGPTLGG